MDILFYKVVDFIQNVFSWINTNFNKKHFRVVKTAFLGYPWDYGYLLDLLEAKLDEMSSYFEKSYITVDDPIIAQRLKTMVNLINIVKEDTDLFEYQGLRVDSFIEEVLDGRSKADKLTFKPAKYVCLVKVNTNNAARFSKSDAELTHLKNYPHELYQRKAKKLLFELMSQYLYCMWN